MRVHLDDKAEFHGNGTATITKRSGITGKTHSMTMQLTFEQYDYWVDKGYLIQEAMPHLSSDEREFLMTGITPEEWEATFGTPEK